MEEGFGCEDGEGGFVDHGARFHPNTDDYCYNCMCHNGTIQMCLSASCGKPPNCVKYEKVERTCCSFICTNGTTSGTDALSTAGIRLAASTATCVLVVALILLLMHKLRRHRLLLNIRQGLRGQGTGADTAVVYSSAYDGVDIDISYEPLHIPGAPPPYSPTCEDLELPPAYSAVSSRNTASVPADSSGVINSGCQITPPESLYNIVAEGRSPNDHTKPGTAKASHQAFDDMKLVERTCGVGASNTDLTLAVDLSDSCNEEQLSSTSSLSPYLRHIPAVSNSRAVFGLHGDTPPAAVHRDTQLARLPVRLEPVGGELPASPSANSTSVGCNNPSPTHNASPTHDASPTHNASGSRRGAVSRSADSSPTVVRHKKVTLTQYGFIDDGSISDLLECNGTVIGLREEQLIDIAANKPDRLNARVRRQNRIKRNSKQLPATPDTPQ